MPTPTRLSSKPSTSMNKSRSSMGGPSMKSDSVRGGRISMKIPMRPDRDRNSSHTDES